MANPAELAGMIDQVTSAYKLTGMRGKQFIKAIGVLPEEFIPNGSAGSEEVLRAVTNFDNVVKVDLDWMQLQQAEAEARQKRKQTEAEEQQKQKQAEAEQGQKQGVNEEPQEMPVVPLEWNLSGPAQELRGYRFKIVALAGCIEEPATPNNVVSLIR